MVEYLEILEEAISDVGYWRWWAEELPAIFQVEFGGVQLHFPPVSVDQKPSNVVALRFHQPDLVAFLTANDATNACAGWPAALHEDRIESFSVSHDLFTMTSLELIQEIAADCRVEYLVGKDLDFQPHKGQHLLAFRSQEVGLIVRAASMTVIAIPGELAPDQIKKAAGDWWAYWREYWDRRDSPDPMPKDYACEVTIPLKA